MQLWSTDEYTRSKNPRNSSALSSIASICLNIKLPFIFNERCYITNINIFNFVLTSVVWIWNIPSFSSEPFANPMQWMVICCALIIKFHTIHKSQRAFLSANQVKHKFASTKGRRCHRIVKKWIQNYLRESKSGNFWSSWEEAIASQKQLRFISYTMQWGKRYWFWHHKFSHESSHKRNALLLH